MVKLEGFKVVIPFAKQGKEFIELCIQKGFKIIDEDMTNGDILFLCFIDDKAIDSAYDICNFKESSLKQISYQDAMITICKFVDVEEEVELPFERGEMVLHRNNNQQCWYIGNYDEIRKDAFKINGTSYLQIAKFDKNIMCTNKSIEHYYFDLREHKLKFGKINNGK